MQWGVDVEKAFGGQRGKTRAPIQGLDIDRGLFVFGAVTHPSPRPYAAGFLFLETPMAEPASTAASVVLVKYGVVMAAFVGSILSLGFLKDLTRWQAATAVATGFLFSVYLTQPVTLWLAPKLELAVTDDLLCGVAFVLGLTAMNIIPALKAFAGTLPTARGA
jgi:hypothetical protein